MTGSKPFRFLSEKLVALIVALGFRSIPNNFRYQREAQNSHCTPGLSGNSVFWAVAAVEMLGWRSRSTFRDWMRSKLRVKWVPSRPTVSAFPQPGSFNCFHGNLAQLTQPPHCQLSMSGGQEVFLAGRRQRTCWRYYRESAVKKGWNYFMGVFELVGVRRESNLVLRKIRCGIGMMASSLLLRDAVVLRENSYCLQDWVPLSLSVSRVELTLCISPQKSGLECLHHTKAVWRNSPRSFKISLSLISMHICSIIFPSSTKYIYSKQTSKGNNLISWK